MESTISGLVCLITLTLTMLWTWRQSVKTKRETADVQGLIDAEKKPEGTVLWEQPIFKPEPSPGTNSEEIYKNALDAMRNYTVNEYRAEMGYDRNEKYSS